MTTILVINAISSLTAGGVIGGLAVRARRHRDREAVRPIYVERERTPDRS